MKMRTILIARSLVIALLIVGLTGFLILSWHDDSRDKAVAAAEVLAAVAAENVGRRVADLEVTLGLIARRPNVRAVDSDSCDDGMRLLRDSDPTNVMISVIASSGKFVCAIDPSPGAETSDFSMRDWFQQAVTENRFVASAPFVGRLAKRLIVVLAHPIRDERQSPIGVVYISHDLAKLGPVFQNANLFPGTSVTVVDRNGVVITRQPEADWVGRNIADQAIFQAATANNAGSGLGMSADGTRLVYGYSAIPNTSWIALVSQPIDAVLADTWAKGQWASAIAAITLLIVTVIGIVSGRLFVGQAGAIARTAQAAADGDTNARMDLPVIEELRTIAIQFNRMLDTRDEAERRIVKLNHMYAALSETSHATTKIADRQEMLDSVCRTASERCDLSLVWIGLLGEETGSIVRAAQYGPGSDYVHGRPAITLRNFDGEGPLTRAIKENRPVIISDIATDSSARPWRRRAQEYGIQSVGVFPLTENGKPIGLINLYSTEKDYFDDPQLQRLISQIAGELSFGLENLQREAARHEIGARFRQIAESIREVFWLTDPAKNRMLYISPAYSEIWGRTTEELYAAPRTWIDAIHEDDRTRILDSATAKQTVGGYDEKYRIVRPDGSVRWIHDRAFPIRDARGVVFRVAGIAEDITERTRMEESLRRGEARLATAQKTAKLGSWERNLVTGEDYWSDEMYRLFERSPSLGVPAFSEFLDYVDPADHQRHIAAARRVRETGEEVSVEFRGKSVSGRARWFRTVMAPLMSSDGVTVGLLGTVLDVSEAKEAEARLFQTQKMEALGNLAGGIAHDFNNMLLPIVNLAEMSREELPADHPVQENLALVVQAATRAGDLVKQILTFGRRSERKLRKLDVADSIREALRLLRNTLPRSIGIVDRIERGIGFVEADPAELHSMILNLGTNAAYAMGGGGNLTLSAARAHLEADRLKRHPRLSADRRYVRIDVSDTGQGMDDATIEKIFNPFFTTKPVGEGSGLGLAMVHGIVESLGGAIDVTSQLNVGTTFSIYLPLADDDVPAA